MNSHSMFTLLRTFRATTPSHHFRAFVVPTPTQKNPAAATLAKVLARSAKTNKAPPDEGTDGPALKAGWMYLYDVIGADFFGDGITSKGVIDALAMVAKAGVNCLNLAINSPGGDVFEGTAIYNLLDRYKGQMGAKVNVYVDSLAASAASYVAMVGDTITIAPNSMFMVHNPWAAAIGNSAAFRTMADTLDKVGGTLLGVYCARTKMSQKGMKDIMDSESWLDAEEALSLGFADQILKPSEMPKEEQAIDPNDPDEDGDDDTTPDEQEGDEPEQVGSKVSPTVTANLPATVELLGRYGKTPKDLVEMMERRQNAVKAGKPPANVPGKPGKVEATTTQKPFGAHSNG